MAFKSLTFAIADYSKTIDKRNVGVEDNYQDAIDVSLHAGL